MPALSSLVPPGGTLDGTDRGHTSFFRGRFPPGTLSPTTIWMDPSLATSVPLAASPARRGYDLLAADSGFFGPGAALTRANPMTALHPDRS